MSFLLLDLQDGRFAPELLDTQYAKEIWALYEAGALHLDSKLRGKFEENLQDVDVKEIAEVIEAARAEEEERQERRRETEQSD